MIFNIITLFPDFFETPLKSSIIGKSIKNRKIKVNIYNLRDFTPYKHKQCDDKPYGGGEGMVMMIEPIYNALKFVNEKWKNNYVIYPSPQGELFSNKKAKELAENKKVITFLCGHYEGVDNRVIENFIDEEISIGDYILTGGEVATLVLIDAISRHIKGVVQKKESVDNDSLNNYLLKYPQYTRPADFKGLKVPEVLLSGNHEEIKKWREEMRIKVTKKKRKDLYKKFKKERCKSE